MPYLVKLFCAIIRKTHKDIKLTIFLRFWMCLLQIYYTSSCDEFLQPLQNVTCVRRKKVKYPGSICKYKSMKYKISRLFHSRHLRRIETGRKKNSIHNVTIWFFRSLPYLIHGILLPFTVELYREWVTCTTSDR